MKISLLKPLLVIIQALCFFHTYSQEKQKRDSSGVTVTYHEINGYVYQIVDEQASYPGGIKALRTYLSKNIKYPDRAVKEGIEGKCIVQFVVSNKGKISKIRIKQGVPGCPECDSEAVRVIQKMPKWEPGKVNGIKVNSTFSVPVSFKL